MVLFKKLFQLHCIQPWTWTKCRMFLWSCTKQSGLTVEGLHIHNKWIWRICLCTQQWNKNYQSDRFGGELQEMLSAFYIHKHASDHTACFKRGEAVSLPLCSLCKLPKCKEGSSFEAVCVFKCFSNNVVLVLKKHLNCSIAYVHLKCIWKKYVGVICC